MIIIWGSKGAGKTSFLGALYFAIKKNNNWTIVPVNEHSNIFIQKIHDQMIDNKEFPLPTDPNDIDKVFTFEIGKNRTNAITKMMYKFRKGSYKKIETSFIDAAGEFFEDPEKEKEFKNYISNNINNVQGILCLIDPDRADSNSDDNKSYFSLLFDNLSKVRSILVSSSSKSSNLDKIPIPIAICLTKMDVKERKEYINSPESFAKNIMGDIAYKLIQNYFDPDLIKYFACSSVGFTEDGGPNIILNSEGIDRPFEVKPVNVIEPFEWLMKKISKQKIR